MALRHANVPKKMNMKAAPSRAWTARDPDENKKNYLRTLNEGTPKLISNLNQEEKDIRALEEEHFHLKLMYYKLNLKYHELLKLQHGENGRETMVHASEFYDSDESDRSTQSPHQVMLRKQVLELEKELREWKDNHKRMANGEEELNDEITKLRQQVNALAEENKFVERTLREMGDENNRLREQLGKDKARINDRMKDQLERFKSDKKKLVEKYNEQKDHHETLRTEKKKYVKLIEKHEESIKEFEEKCKSWDEFQKVRKHKCSGDKTAGPCPEMSTLEDLCTEIENGLDPSEVDLSEDYLEWWRTTVLKTMNLSLTKLYCVQTKAEESKDIFLKEFHRITKLYDSPSHAQNTTTRVRKKVTESTIRTEKTNSKTESEDRDTSKRNNTGFESSTSTNP